MENSDVGEVRENIGSLKAIAEAHQQSIDRLFQVIESKDAKDERKFEEIKSVLDELKDQFKAYKVVAKTIKFILSLVVLTITLKFGDIPSLWRNL